jgi:hypothetical protein
MTGRGTKCRPHLDFRLSYPYNPTIIVVLPRKRKEVRPERNLPAAPHPTIEVHRGPERPAQKENGPV